MVEISRIELLPRLVNILKSFRNFRAVFKVARKSQVKRRELRKLGRLVFTPAWLLTSAAVLSLFP